jgi:maltose alpha-D-glucosyltransferase/alpha-amylase
VADAEPIVNVTEKATSDLWWKNAIIYCVDVANFLDGNGDGIGDLSGLTSRMDYLAELGVSCLWLLPVHPSTGVDGGYDVTDYYAIDPRYGTLGDFVEMVRTAREVGIRVVLDMVLNHTSYRHPWFQAAGDPESPFHDYYVWADEPPDDAPPETFPGEQDGTWSKDDRCGRWYLHHYYAEMPDLNIANERVRDEMNKVMGFWLELGVSGFRIDSAPFLIETFDSALHRDHDYLKHFRSFLSRRRGDVVLMGEANVAPEEQVRYFGDGAIGDEMQMLFDFAGCAALWTALWDGTAEPLRAALAARPPHPDPCQYTNFARHHDELSFEPADPDTRRRMLERFPAEARVYGRGLRRRLTPLLDGDQRPIRLALSLTLSLPGTPMLLYGDEIGLGDDLDLPARNAVRVPMQWTSDRHGGFTTAERSWRPVEPDGRYGYRQVNVRDQQRDSDSPLSWTRLAIRSRRSCPELGWGGWRLLDAGDERVLAHRCDWRTGSVLVLHNLSDREVTARLAAADRTGDGELDEIFADRDYPRPDRPDQGLELGPYGYRWLRADHSRRIAGAI